MRTFITHFETLPQEQRLVLPALKPVRDLGFVLYGGTAIALRLGHRISVDFDFFTDLKLDRRAVLAIPVFQNGAVFQDEPDALGILVKVDEGEVKVSLFGDISFGRVGIPERTQDGSLDVASVDDLLATKLKVLLQRVEAKDYVDIDALLRSGASLERGLSAARSLYGSAFSPSESLRALTYFDEGDLSGLSSEHRRSLEERVARCEPIPEIPIVSRTLAAYGEATNS